MAVLLCLAAAMAWRRQLASALRRPLDADALHRLVLGFDLSPRPRAASTLGAWPARMEDQGRSWDLPALVFRLQALRYASTGADLPEAVAALRAWLRTVRRRPRTLSDQG